MNKFEAVLLFNPDLSTQILQKEVENFTNSIKNTKGKVISDEDWGLRDLGYNIKNYKKSFYKFYQLEMDGKNLQEIKKNLTQNEQVLRHLFVKVENHQKLPTKMTDEEK